MEVAEMGEKPSITGFLKGMLGFGVSKAETLKNDPPANAQVTPAAATPSNPNGPGFAERGSEEIGPTAPNKSRRPTPQTEAYQNRKKGRKRHRETLEDLKRIIASIQHRGEATPGELAKELGMARSTLAYNLNRFLAYSPDYETTRKDYWENHLMHFLLGPKRLERTGAGPSLRYRLVDVPSPGSHSEPGHPNPSMGSTSSPSSGQAGLGTGQRQPESSAQEQEGSK
jgi:hypothetical protein